MHIHLRNAIIFGVQKRGARLSIDSGTLCQQHFPRALLFVIFFSQLFFLLYLALVGSRTLNLQLLLRSLFFFEPLIRFSPSVSLGSLTVRPASSFPSNPWLRAVSLALAGRGGCTLLLPDSPFRLVPSLFGTSSPVHSRRRPGS